MGEDKYAKWAGDEAANARALNLIQENGTLPYFLSFLAADDGTGVTFGDDAREVAHLTDIGADWYIFQGREFRFYVVANQGHAGGSSLSPGSMRALRPFRFWRTDAAQPLLQQWDAALAFITGEVHRSLEAEWG